MCGFQEKCLAFVHMKNFPYTLQNAHGNISIRCQMVLISNITLRESIEVLDGKKQKLDCIFEQ